MKKQFNRRDFLKLSSLLPLGMAAPHLFRTFQQGQPKNVLIVVFDAWSAYNVSLYGYPRNTTPNIDRLAQRAIRYHNHFAGGNFTTPGTASLLTGVLPWTHRAFRMNGNVADAFVPRNLFSAFKDHYNISYTHNPLAVILLNQFGADINELIPREKLLVDSVDSLISRSFKNDVDIASISWARNVKINDDGHAYSLFLSHLYEDIQEKKLANLARDFPRGVPTTETADIGFTLEQARTYITERLSVISQPFAGYFHFLPPHEPYRTSSQFCDFFKGDRYKPVEKPVDIFAVEDSSGTSFSYKRRLYDEFILYCDEEFGKLYDTLEKSGVLENTWLVLTSDHGELFERGIYGHTTDALYQPVVRVPLMIFEPGRTTGMDIHDYTSAIDVLPTLAHVTGEPIPEWVEGVILPPFAPIPDRSVYAIRAVKNGKYDPFTVGSFIQVRGGYKLHYYFGYPQTSGDGLVKLYDIRSDPEEMNDLAALKPETTAELLNELKAKLKQVDAPYL